MANSLLAVCDWDLPDTSLPVRVSGGMLQKGAHHQSCKVHLQQ